MKTILLTLMLVCSLLQAYPQCDLDGVSTGTILFKPFGWTDLLGVPDELNRKRLKFDDMRYGNPYTLIDRDRFPDANTAFNEIRKVLQSEKNNELRLSYSKMFSEAIGLRPASGGNWDPDVSELAIWAKYNAFIYVIGLEPDKFKFLDDLGPEGKAVRDGFRDRAMDAFRYMDCRVPSAPYDGLYEPTNRLQKRARELIMWCEAYDWLKGAAYDAKLDESRWPLPKGDNDRNEGDCSPRNRLRLLARNFYAAAEGSFFGPIENRFTWKRNHGIMSASAIGMAAIVLNDAGVETNAFILCNHSPSI